MQKTEVFKKVLDENQIKMREPLSNHISFRVGGECDALLLPCTDHEVENCIGLCRENDIPYYILGKGSNIIVGDKGYRGVMISTKALNDTLHVEDVYIEASAGLSLSDIAKFALENSLTGMEFASGIPGSLGGAVVMNAGAYGSEMIHILDQVRVLESDGSIIWLNTDELEMGYRKSNIIEKSRVVLGARLKLRHGKKGEIEALMNDLAFRRSDKQPLEYPSAGSVFKRPEGYFAGKLIEDAGLRGFGIGGACVSDKHCGFIINKGNASARDVLDTINAVKKRVYEIHGVRLECEVRMLGEF